MDKYVPEDKAGKFLRCLRHGEVFRAGLATCTGCDADPEPLPDLEAEAEENIPTPEGCRSTLEYERKLTELQDLLMDALHGATKADKKAYSTIQKLGDTVIKAIRAGADLAKQREQRHYYKTLAESATADVMDN